MCGRYYLSGLDEFQVNEYLQMMAELYGQITIDNSKVKLSGEIYPTDVVPVIANNKRLEPRAYFMKWGYKQGNSLIFNARSETAHEKQIFKDGIKRRRCLIPASHYFEWEKEGAKKSKHAIKPTGQNIIFMAGIYRIEQGNPVFSILTRQTAEDISFIHNRMPVILSKQARRDWLNIDIPSDETIKSALIDTKFWKVV